MSDVTMEYSNTSHTITPTTLGMEKMMEEYIAYKSGNTRDPEPNMKGAESVNICNKFYRVGARKQLACGDDLHKQPHVRPDHEGRQDHVHGQAGHHRGHPGTLHRIFGDQRDRGENQMSKETKTSILQNQTSKSVKPIIYPDHLLLGQTSDRSAWKPEEKQEDEGK